MSLSLLDLPTEILQQILKDPNVQAETVFGLALLCRRLHFTALPIYFSLNGFDAEKQSMTIAMRADGRDLLCALRTALFIPPLQKISFILPHPSCVSVLPLLHHLARVEDILSQVPTISAVSLQLDTQGSICCSVGKDEALCAWAAHFGRLLNYIVDRGCKSLTVVHGGYFTQAYELVPSPTIIHPVARMSRFSRFKFLHRKSPPIRLQGAYGFQRVLRQGDEHFDVSFHLDTGATGRLTALHIQSAILLVPPGLSWTLAALQNCSISTLSFSKIVLSSRVWNTVLPLLAASAAHVTSITFIELAYVADADIVRFVSSLPRLESLTISARDGPVGTTLSSSSGPVPLLGHLTHLRAPPDFIRYFMMRPISAASTTNVSNLLILPALKELCVECSRYASVNIDHTIQTLTPLLHTLDSTRQLRTTEPILGLTTNAILYNHGYMGADAFLASSQLELAANEHALPAPLPNLSAHAQATLDRVQTLLITLYSTIDVRDVVAWVRTFRYVHRVEFDVPDPAVGVRIADIALALARAIPRTDFLPDIHVNGKLYGLVTGV